MIKSSSAPSLTTIQPRFQIIPEPAVYMKGLPITSDADRLKKIVLDRSEQIFGSNPTLFDLYTDENGSSTGEAYLEFEDHNIKGIIQKSNGCKLGKNILGKNIFILTTQCRLRPKGVPEPSKQYAYLASYGVWTRIWTEEELTNM